MKNFGIRLKMLRESRRLTLEQLAKELNCAIYGLSLWEKSKRTLSLQMLIDLAKYFNVTVDYLIGL